MIIQDTGDIIDQIEARHAEPVKSPAGPVQRTVAMLFDALGSEYLPALAMHYPWTERMNIASGPDGEFADYPEDYCADEAIPETLESVLKLVFRDWTPGLAGDARARLDALVSRTGGTDMMAISLVRPIKREDNVMMLG